MINKEKPVSNALKAAIRLNNMKMNQVNQTKPQNDVSPLQRRGMFPGDGSMDMI